MSRCLVTGVAGFIGSSLAERLVAEGREVVGVDCFTDNYARELKEGNLRDLLKNRRFRFLELDLRTAALESLLDGVEGVFHQAALPGVRQSWGREFEQYCGHNILATQRLLEACKERGLKRFIHASSSSVYGEAETMPTPETLCPAPISPYGLTKLAADQLCHVYWKNFGVPVVMLRYFTVYGPRQRPDMAFQKFFLALRERRTLEIYGDGTQTRDFTFIQDAIQANLSAMTSQELVLGKVYNIGGGTRVTLNHVLDLIQKIVGIDSSVNRKPIQKGDPKNTSADIRLAQQQLGYCPKIRIEEGLREQWEWNQYGK
ncbi:MAG: GDP-mannose 4,6-dehydratase [Deltaproteobacteria bacterium]|nr:GDP-mannose 4,6-dehydratase [Deltaproteobacteria bacterium]